jgi:uncharacterized protein
MDRKGMTAVLEASRLIVDVSELLHQPGSRKHVTAEQEVPGLTVDLARIEGGNVRADLELHAIVEGILATGSVSAAAVVECRRCLTEKPVALRVSVEEVFTRAGSDEQGYRVEGETLDLEPMVRDAIVLALPLNPLCRPDCRGLCPACGQNLNEADCGHHRESAGDARWEPLRRLIDQIGE